jgi:hypothetical protein
MSDEALRRVRSGESWAAFCDALKAAGATVLGEGTPAGELDRSEGFRYLSRLTRLSLEMMLEFADPDFPVFYAASHDTIKVFAPNPDTLYLNATIAGDREYRIVGERGTVPYLSFGTKANRYAIDGTMASTGELDGADLELDADGRFEIVLSARAQAGNWLPLAADSSMVIVRENFLDRAREKPATMRIERIGGRAAPQPLTAAQLDAALRAAAAFVGNTARTLADLTRQFAQYPNQLQYERYRELSMRSGGDPNIAYFHGFWQLGDGEALVVETEVPECPYWNFQVNNWWMESLDYRYLPVAVNKHGARHKSDGSVTILVAAENPGADNFIDTAGHHSGTMLLRWISAKTHPQPRCRVVILKDWVAPQNL